MQRLRIFISPVMAAVLGVLIWSVPYALVASDGHVVVEEGALVSIEFTLTLDDGSVMDSNVGEGPLSFIQGGGQVLPAVEAALAGKAGGESVTFRLNPEQAYGIHEAHLVREFPAGAIPEQSRRVGEQLTGRDSSGRTFQATVVEYLEDEQIVFLDYNHPLAGKHLNFDVTIISVE